MRKPFLKGQENEDVQSLKTVESHNQKWHSCTEKSKLSSDVSEVAFHSPGPSTCAQPSYT